jgi:hypothetical protein
LNVSSVSASASAAYVQQAQATRAAVTQQQPAVQAVDSDGDHDGSVGGTVDIKA